jgi:hypothetical protein
MLSRFALDPPYKTYRLYDRPVGPWPTDGGAEA